MNSSKLHLNQDLSSLTVLLVDDNREMRKLLRAVLNTLKVGPIIEAEAATDALKVLHEMPIDLVITDLNMDPVSGLDLVRMVRKGDDSANPRVPIIMLTGHTEYQRVCEARDAGVNEFLAKPISAKALYMRFASIIDNPRAFIRTKTYFGPDRRRQNIGPPRGIGERRKEEKEKMAAAEKGGSGLSQDEVEKLMK